jgi:hypothetical protein
MAAELTSIDLVQYGAMGILLTYFITQDYLDRRHRRQKEHNDAVERQQKDKEAAKREQDCIKASEQIRKHQMEVIAPLMHTANQLHKATLSFMKSNKLHTPLPDIQMNLQITEEDIHDHVATDDDTRILHRKI